jgi:hypothetical protein
MNKRIAEGIFDIGSSVGSRAEDFSENLIGGASSLKEKISQGINRGSRRARGLYSRAEEIPRKILSGGIERFKDGTGIKLIPDILVHPNDENVTTLDIKGYRQIDGYSCGFAAGMMIVHTFHPKYSIDRFYRLAGTDESGTNTTPLISALKKSGVGVKKRYDLNFSRISETIEEGYPIISLVSRPKCSHWVVIYGYGKNPNRVYVGGNTFPFVGKNKYLWSEFRRIWDEKGFGLICWGK